MPIQDAHPGNSRKIIFRVVKTVVLGNGGFVPCRKQGILTKTVTVTSLHSTYTPKQGFWSSDPRKRRKRWVPLRQNHGLPTAGFSQPRHLGIPNGQFRAIFLGGWKMPKLMSWARGSQGGVGANQIATNEVSCTGLSTEIRCATYRFTGNKGLKRTEERQRKTDSTAPTSGKTSPLDEYVRDVSATTSEM